MTLAKKPVQPDHHSSPLIGRRAFTGAMSFAFRAPRGFSLIEMMVVVSILGIIAVMAVPTFEPVVRRQRVEAATDTVANFVARARMLAVTSGRCVRVRISTPQPATLVAEQLNIYDCMDSSSDPAVTARIDGNPPAANNLWLPAFRLSLDDKTIEVSFTDQNGTDRQPIRQGGAFPPPAGLHANWLPDDEELVYRPTGRLWSDHDPVVSQDPTVGANSIYNDDGVLHVRARSVPTEQAYIVAASHGPICVLRLGKVLVGTLGDYTCP